jgi:hypothetical protein
MSAADSAAIQTMALETHGRASERSDQESNDV